MRYLITIVDNMPKEEAYPAESKRPNGLAKLLGLFLVSRAGDGSIPSKPQPKVNEEFPGPGYFVDENPWAATGRADYDLPLGDVYIALGKIGKYRQVALESLKNHPVPEE